MQRRYSNSVVRVFEIDYESVMSELEEYARKSLDKGAKAVILIGSLARGDYTAFSDADLIIVVERSEKRFVDRSLDFMDPSLSVDIEPRVYTLDEIIEMSKQGRKLIGEILEYGKLLAGEKRIIEIISENFRYKDRSVRLKRDKQ